MNGQTNPLNIAPTRREFIYTSGAAVAAATVLGAGRAHAANKKLKVGQIGRAHV